MHPELLNIYHRYAVASFGKQLYLAKLVAGLDWHFNVTTGLLSFGDRYCWKAQILGTEAYQDLTWLWSWANRGSAIPTPLLGSAISLRLFGEAWQIVELTEPQLEFYQCDRHLLAMIASGICNADAYYQCPFKGGAVFLLIKDDNFPQCAVSPLSRIATMFPKAISSIDIFNHKFALLGYFEYYAIPYQAIDNMLVVAENGEVVLRATFDENNRLKQLDSMMKG